MEGYKIGVLPMCMNHDCFLSTSRQQMALALGRQSRALQVGTPFLSRARFFLSIQMRLICWSVGVSLVNIRQNRLSYGDMEAGQLPRASPPVTNIISPYRNGQKQRNYGITFLWTRLRQVMSTTLAIRNSPKVWRVFLSSRRAARVPPTSPPSRQAYLWCCSLSTRLSPQMNTLKVTRNSPMKAPNLRESPLPSTSSSFRGSLAIFLTLNTAPMPDLIRQLRTAALREEATHAHTQDPLCLQCGVRVRCRPICCAATSAQCRRVPGRGRLLSLGLSSRPGSISDSRPISTLGICSRFRVLSIRQGVIMISSGAINYKAEQQTRLSGGDSIWLISCVMGQWLWPWFRGHGRQWKYPWIIINYNSQQSAMKPAGVRPQFPQSFNDQSQAHEFKKYHNYSLSFYQKEDSLKEVSNRARLGFDNFQRHDKILKPRTIELFIKFTDKNREGQHSLLVDESDLYMDALMDVVRNLNSNRELMEFVLPTIDAILTYEPSVLRELVAGIIEAKNTSALASVKSILAVDSHQPATYESAARIVCIVLGELPREAFLNEQKNFVLELLTMRKDRSRQKVSDFCLLNCLVYLNKHQVLAEVFLENGGGQLILDAFKQYGSDTQVLYYILLNVWLLSFVEVAIEKFIAVPKYGVLRNVCEILQKLSREKLTRVAFMIFKNVESNHLCLELLIDSKLIKIIDTLLKGNIKNEELLEQIRNTGAVLENNIKVLSNFEKYQKEINNDVLQWSSVHTERFWKENAMKFEHNDFQLIRKLKDILLGRDDNNIAIACYDLGEFCRFYPKGRNVIEDLHIKEQIMEKARYSQDKAVREQALLALQKLMIQNWQSI